MPESDARNLEESDARSVGADLVGGQLRGDKESPFSGVTKSGRVWRNVPESGVQSARRPGRSRRVTGHASRVRHTDELP